MTFFLEKIDFLSLNTILFLREIMFSLKRLKKIKSSPSINEIFYPRTNVLNEIFNTCKTHGDKRGLGHINKVETPTNRETIFLKGK